MYVTTARNAGGLGFPPLVAAVIAAIATAAGTATVTRLISGPSSPSQKQVEDQLRLQQQLEIQRMLEQQKIQEQQTSQLGQYVLPALGLVALVAVLS